MGKTLLIEFWCVTASQAQLTYHNPFEYWHFHIIALVFFLFSSFLFLKKKNESKSKISTQTHTHNPKLIVTDQDQS